MFASNYYKRDSRYTTLYYTQKTQGERRSKENNVNYELGRTCIKVNISCAMNFKWSGIYLKLKKYCPNDLKANLLFDIVRLPKILYHHMLGLFICDVLNDK